MSDNEIISIEPNSEPLTDFPHNGRSSEKTMPLYFKNISTEPEVKRHHRCPDSLDQIMHTDELQTENSLSAKSNTIDLWENQYGAKKRKSLTMSDPHLVEGFLAGCDEPPGPSSPTEDKNDQGRFITVHYKSPETRKTPSRRNSQNTPENLEGAECNHCYVSHGPRTCKKEDNVNVEEFCRARLTSVYDGVPAVVTPYSDTDIVSLDVVNPLESTTNRGRNVVVENISTLSSDDGRILHDVHVIGLQPRNNQKHSEASCPELVNDAEPSRPPLLSISYIAYNIGTKSRSDCKSESDCFKLSEGPTDSSDIRSNVEEIIINPKTGHTSLNSVQDSACFLSYELTDSARSEHLLAKQSTSCQEKILETLDTTIQGSRSSESTKHKPGLQNNENIGIYLRNDKDGMEIKLDKEIAQSNLPTYSLLNSAEIDVSSNDISMAKANETTNLKIIHNPNSLAESLENDSNKTFRDDSWDNDIKRRAKSENCELSKSLIQHDEVGIPNYITTADHKTNCSMEDAKKRQCYNSNSLISSLEERLQEAQRPDNDAIKLSKICESTTSLQPKERLEADSYDAETETHSFPDYERLVCEFSSEFPSSSGTTFSQILLSPEPQTTANKRRNILLGDDADISISKDASEQNLKLLEKFPVKTEVQQNVGEWQGELPTSKTKPNDSASDIEVVKRYVSNLNLEDEDSVSDAKVLIRTALKIIREGMTFKKEKASDRNLVLREEFRKKIKAMQELTKTAKVIKDSESFTIPGSVLVFEEHVGMNSSLNECQQGWCSEKAELTYMSSSKAVGVEVTAPSDTVETIISNRKVNEEEENNETDKEAHHNILKNINAVGSKEQNTKEAVSKSSHVDVAKRPEETWGLISVKSPDECENIADLAIPSVDPSEVHKTGMLSTDFLDKHDRLELAGTLTSDVKNADLVSLATKPLVQEKQKKISIASEISTLDISEQFSRQVSEHITETDDFISENFTKYQNINSMLEMNNPQQFDHNYSLDSPASPKQPKITEGDACSTLDLHASMLKKPSHYNAESPTQDLAEGKRTAEDFSEENDAANKNKNLNKNEAPNEESRIKDFILKDNNMEVLDILDDGNLGITNKSYAAGNVTTNSKAETDEKQRGADQTDSYIYNGTVLPEQETSQIWKNALADSHTTFADERFSKDPSTRSTLVLAEEYLSDNKTFATDERLNVKAIPATLKLRWSNVDKTRDADSSNVERIFPFDTSPLTEERQQIYATLLELQDLSEEWLEFVEQLLNPNFLQPNRQLEQIKNQSNDSLPNEYLTAALAQTPCSDSGMSRLNQTAPKSNSKEKMDEDDNQLSNNNKKGQAPKEAYLSDSVISKAYLHQVLDDGDEDDDQYQEYISGTRYSCQTSSVEPLQLRQTCDYFSPETSNYTRKMVESSEKMQRTCRQVSQGQCAKLQPTLTGGFDFSVHRGAMPQTPDQRWSRQDVGAVWKDCKSAYFVREPDFKMKSNIKETSVYQPMTRNLGMKSVTGSSGRRHRWMLLKPSLLRASVQEASGVNLCIWSGTHPIVTQCFLA